MADLIWQAIGEGVVLAWQAQDERRGSGPVGLVVWGGLDTDSLRIPLSRQALEREGYPTWRQQQPPNAAQVRARWLRQANARETTMKRSGKIPTEVARRKRSEAEVLAEEENWAEAERKESEQALQAALEAAGATRESGKYTFEHRRAGESTGEFYQRVAIFYRCLVGEGEYPTKTIEKAGAVPPATARRWVNEARRRGFLAATKRGRVSDVH